MNGRTLIFLIFLSTSVYGEMGEDDRLFLTQALEKMPTALANSMKATLAAWTAASGNTEHIAARMHALRCGLERAQKRGYNPYVALNALQNGANTGSLGPVWQALMYCGALCCLYLIVVAIRDNDARTIINEQDKKTAFQKKKILQNALINATNALVESQMLPTRTPAAGKAGAEK